VRVEEYAYCQQTSPKRWFGNVKMTSNCDVTENAPQTQMTTICHWKNPPHENFLRTTLDEINDSGEKPRKLDTLAKLSYNEKWICILTSGVTRGGARGTCAPGRSVLGSPNWGRHVQ